MGAVPIEATGEAVDQKELPDNRMGREGGIVNEREQAMYEASRWAAQKRDGRIVTPDLVMSRQGCETWRQGYYFAMNDAAQHFNMERLYAKEAS